MSRNISPALMHADHIVKCLTLIIGNIVILSKLLKNCPDWTRKNKITSIPGQDKGAILIICSHQDDIIPIWSKTIGLLIEY